MKLKIICLLLISFVFSNTYYSNAQIPGYLKKYSKEYIENPRAANLKWFENAKFGLFIHYGIYSQLGKGEWIQLTDTIPLNEYVTLKDSFNPSGFDADFIVQLAKKAGMKYITITTKHHDGFCLFKTKETDFNSINSPAGRDLIAELYEACKKGGLGLFLYYSYAADWNHPWFYSRDIWPNARPAYEVPPKEYKYEKPEDFRKYIDYVHSQLKELLTQYPTAAGIWFDPINGYYSNSDAFPLEETYALIRDLSPHALISFKQGANGDEDFMAPERGGHARTGGENPVALRAYEMNINKPREVCNTMQPLTEKVRKGTWGYHKGVDGHHLKVDDVKILLGDALLNRNNLLLNIGPLPDGSVHPEDIKTLSNLKK